MMRSMMRVHMPRTLCRVPPILWLRYQWVLRTCFGSTTVEKVMVSRFALAMLAATRLSIPAWAFGILPAYSTTHRLMGTSTSRAPWESSEGHQLCARTARSRDGTAPGCRETGSRSALQMSKSAKEGDVVLKSVKVGPLKQENVYLPSGVSMQAMSQAPTTGSSKRSKPLPPLVFIHGSYHGAWCWAEHWMPFLASKGYDTYSISLRGTSGTPFPGPEGDASGVKVKISDHVADVRSFAETVLPGRRPIFVSHSFGGVVLLKLMEELANEPETTRGAGNGARSSSGEREGIRGSIAGGAFLCSVPPSGNGPMTKRFIKERPVMAVKIVLGFVLKMAVYWPWLARDLFFCQSLEQSTLKRYMSSFQADSKNGLDLGDLRAQLPSKKADAEGRAGWIQHAPPRLVMGGERDRIVDEAGVEETATFLDTDHIMLPNVPHEVMLGPDWPLGVARLLQWLEATDFTIASKP